MEGFAELDASATATSVAPDAQAAERAVENGDHDAEKALEKDPRYPLKVLYCAICGLPAEIHDHVSTAHFRKCRPWLAANCPELFPEEFPEEAAAKLEALRIAEESGEASNNLQTEVGDASGNVKVAVPIEQKGTVGKKKKIAPEIIIMLAQRKGKKQVTVVYGLDLFGIKLSDAAKAAKKKFATGASVARSADARDVIEIQGTRQEEFAELAHAKFGIPKDVVFIVDPKSKKKAKAFS